MSSLLAIETAADACSVALAEDGRLRATNALYRPRSHSERLVPMIKDLFLTGGIEIVDVVAVSSGPGSYTGLRIGVSTAKGLAMAFGAELVGVPTLEALAAAALPVASEGGAVASFLRARRGEWFAAGYRIGGHGLTREPIVPPTVIADDDMAEWIGHIEPSSPLWLVSSGSEVPDVGRGRFIQVRTQEPTPLHARFVALLGWERFQEGDVEDHASFEPFYLRPYRPKQPSSPFAGLSKSR